MQHSPAISVEEHYNYDHFHPTTLKRDFKLVMKPSGPLLGDEAPDFSLQDTQGQLWTLRELRGRPVVLIFGSGTCPMTTGSTPGLNKLYREFGDEAQWLMIYVREAHPGEAMPAHGSLAQKRDQAERLRTEEGIEWPVLVDELDGRIHEAYSTLPNHLFLIDHDGRIAFRGEFAHAPTLWKALAELRAQSWRGQVVQGIDKKMHMLGASVFGWRGPQRGGKIAKKDIAKGAPPLAVNLKVGQWSQPLLASLAARSRPLPLSTKLALAAGTLGLLALGVWVVRR